MDQENLRKAQPKRPQAVAVLNKMIGASIVLLGPRDTMASIASRMRSGETVKESMAPRAKSAEEAKKTAELLRVAKSAASTTRPEMGRSANERAQPMRDRRLAPWRQSASVPWRPAKKQYKAKAGQQARRAAKSPMLKAEITWLKSGK